MENGEIYDLVILGSGIGGLTAAIYAGRYALKTLVIGKLSGGVASTAGEIENWPGYSGPGIDLMRTVRSQAERFGAEILDGEVISVKKDANGFLVDLGGKNIYGKTLIVALGMTHRQLNIPGEKEFLGKGVSYCATCDGNFFKGKNVVVVGGADSAAKAIVYLSKICKKVHVVYRRDKLRGEPIYLSRIEEADNVEIHYNSDPLEILGDTKVSGLNISTRDGEEKTESTLEVDGVFIEIGATPVADVVGGLGLKLEKDFIMTDKATKTSVDGVFAAGDITNNAMKQMVTAAAEGAVAAKEAHDFLNEQKK